MNVLQPFTIISLTALIFYSILLAVILTRDVRNRLRQSFVVYLISMIVWSFGSFMLFSEIHIGDVLFWNRFMVVGSMLMPIAFCRFVQEFLMRDWRKWLTLGYLFYAAGSIANLYGLVIQSAYLDDGRLISQNGPAAYYLAAVSWVLFIGFSAFNLFGEFRITKDPVYRNRIKHLLIVIIVIFAGSLTNGIEELSVFPVDIAFNVVSALLIANALLRHQLLDIDVVVRKGVLYSIPTVIIGISYFLIMWVSYKLFHGFSDLQFLPVSLVLAVITALIAQPFRDRTQYMIDRIFFREKYDSSLMLQRVSQTAAHVLDLSQLTDMILSEVTSTLHLNKAAFFLKREDSGEYYLMAQKGMEVNANLRLSRSNPIVLYLASHDQALSRHEISVEPQFRSMWTLEREDIDKVGAELFVPLKAKGELVGIFSVGSKLSEESFSQDDQLTLTTLGNQTAVAIENARLFAAEQFRREELDALYNLTRQLVATDEVGTVLESTTRNAVESIHVTFARVFTVDDDGIFYCRAASPARSLVVPLGVGRNASTEAQTIYKEALISHDPITLTRNSPLLSDVERHALMLDIMHSICIVPLHVGDVAIGVLVLGEARSTIREPFDSDKLRLVSAIADQAANALQRANLHEQMETSFVQTVVALANAADARDSYTQNHSDRLASLAEATCEEMALPDDVVKAIHWAALLHDIGKIGVPDEILRKPGPLTDSEWAIMKRHPVIGAKIVAPVKKLANVAPIIRAHHERYDGTGYPNGLKGEEIPIGARLLSVVDAYGAMTDDRVYRNAHSHAEAIEELQRCSGTQFDPKVVAAFLNAVEHGALRSPQPIALRFPIQGSPDATTKPIPRTIQ